MRIDLINEVARARRIERKDLLEKDIILHEILADLSSNQLTRDGLAFKGGTCLAKAYLGYLRFSEDIDFTWRKQGAFKGKTTGKIRKEISETTDKTAKVFQGIALKRGLDFECKKKDRRYFEFGGGNKTCTMKIWYDSEILKRNTYLKVQINFIERMCYPVRRLQLESLVGKGSEELVALFPAHTEYMKSIPFYGYDAREILGEKIRAILTREGTKARDFVDVYFISKRLGISPEKVETCAVTKTDFALRQYKKYRDNFKAKVKLLDSGNIFTWGQERSLLMTKIDEKDFYSFLESFQSFLITLVSKMQADTE